MEVKTVKIKTVILKHEEVIKILLDHCGLPSDTTVDLYDCNRNIGVDTIEVGFKHTEKVK